MAAEKLILMTGGLDSYIIWRLEGRPKGLFFNFGHPANQIEMRSLKKIEDHFGVRYTDNLYRPIFDGGNGKINTFKVNTLDDIHSMLNVYDNIPEILDSPYINADTMLGLTPYQGHAKEMVAKLSHTLYDVNSQLWDTAIRLTNNPDDILSAVQFEKLRSISGILSSQLTDGKPAEEALMRLAKYNFRAYSDAEVVEIMKSIVESNYAIFRQLKTDTRATHMLADMIDDLGDTNKIGKFLNSLSRVDDYTSMFKENSKLIQFRKILSQQLDEACGAV